MKLNMITNGKEKRELEVESWHDAIETALDIIVSDKTMFDTVKKLEIESESVNMKVEVDLLGL